MKALANKIIILAHIHNLSYMRVRTRVCEREKGSFAAFYLRRESAESNIPRLQGSEVHREREEKTLLQPCGARELKPCYIFAVNYLINPKSPRTEQSRLE